MSDQETSGAGAPPTKIERRAFAYGGGPMASYPMARRHALPSLSERDRALLSAWFADFRNPQRESLVAYMARHGISLYGEVSEPKTLSRGT